MAKEDFWTNDTPASPASDGGDFWSSDRPAAQVDLPEEVTPSQAGAGRGSGGYSGPKAHDGYPARTNADGSISTEVSLTVTNPRLNGGRPTNIPSLWGGVELDEDLAVDQAIKSGRSFQPFPSIDTAVDAARKRSEAGGANAPASAYDRPAPAAAERPARQSWEDDADQLMADTAAPSLGKNTSVLEGVKLQPEKPWSFREASENRRRIDDMPVRRGESILTPVPDAVAAGMDTRDAIQNPAARGVIAGVTGLGQVLPGAVEAAADFVGADGVADFAARSAGAGRQFAAPLAPKGGNEKLVFDIANSITQTAPTLLLGLGGGPAMTGLFSQSAAQEYSEGRSKGLDGASAAGRAGVMASAEVIGERFGFSEQIKILKGLAARIPADQLAPVFARQIMKEIPGEQLTTLIQFLGDKAGPGALNPEATLAEYLDQAGETLKVTIGQTAVMGGGPTIINKVREGLPKPIDRTPQIEALRKSGDELAAAHLERKSTQEKAAYSADREAGALKDFGQDLQDQYRTIRASGATTGTATTQTAARWTLAQASQMAGLSPKAQDAITAKLEQLPPEKAAAFVQKAITGLVNNGMAQPFDGIDTLAMSIEQQRDRMLDSVLSVMDEPQTTEGEQDATQEAAAVETEAAQGLDAGAAETGAIGDPAVSGAGESGGVGALSPSDEFADLFDEQGRPKFSNAKSVRDFKSRTNLGQDGVRAIQVAIENGRSITVEEASQADIAARTRRDAALEQNKAESEAEAKAAKENASKPSEERTLVGEYEIPGIEGARNRVRVFQQAGKIEAVGIDDGTANNDLSGLIKSGQSVEQALATMYGDHAPDAAPDASKVSRNPIGSITEKTNVQDAQAPAAGTQAQAAPVEAPAAGGSDAAAASGVPAAGGAAGVRADGVEAQVYKIVRDVSRPGTTQTRAKEGGEYGPNGEWYKGGAFIATTDLPKKAKQFIERAKVSSQKQLVIEPATASTPAVKALPRVGEFPIFERINDVWRPDLPGGINGDYIAYLRSQGGDGMADQLVALSEKYRAGERWAKVTEHPEMSRVEDVVRMLVAGQPVPGAAIEKLAPAIRDALRPMNDKVSGVPAKAGAGDVQANGVKLNKFQEREVSDGGSGIAGELDAETISSLVAMRSNPNVPALKALERGGYTGKPEFIDIGNGYGVRAYKMGDDVRQEIKLPNGMIVTRGLTGDGSVYGEAEGDFDQIVKGKGFPEVTRYFKEFAEGRKPKAPDAVLAIESSSGQADGVDPGYIGANSQPVSEGAKPFKTDAAAKKAKKLHPGMRVKKVEGGYVLRPATEKEQAAAEKAGKRLGGVGNPGLPMAAHELVASRGGLSQDTMADLGFDRNVRVGSLWLFAGKGKGMSIAQASEALSQYGYMGEDDINQALSLISRSAKGQPQYTPEGFEAVAAAEDAARFEDYLAAEQEGANEFEQADEQTLADLEAAEYYELNEAEQAEFRAIVEAATAEDIDFKDMSEEATRLIAEENRDETTDTKPEERGDEKPDPAAGIEQGRQAAEPESTGSREPVSGEEGGAGSQASVKLEAWQTEIPSTGVSIQAGDQQVDGARKVLQRIAKEAVDAVTQNQKINGGALYAYVLPAANGTHGAVRLFPDDQTPPKPWKLMFPEAVRYGFVTPEQTAAKLVEALAREPVLSSDPEPTTIESHSDGTLSVTGDSASLKERLTAAGIPAKSIVKSARGVVVGKTQAKKAREVLETPTLTAPTKADIEAQQDRAEQAARDNAAKDKADEAKAAKERERADVKRLSESAADTFELGGDAMANLTGQKDIFGAVESDVDGPMFSRSAKPETAAFANWFGDSKIVNPDGSPMVVYHGTAGDFARFGLDEDVESMNRILAGSGVDMDGRFFFTDAPEVASDYAEQNNEGGEGGNVMPVYLSIKNPLAVDAKGSRGRDKFTLVEDSIGEAIDGGYDGLVLRNIFDFVTDNPATQKKPHNVYIAFKRPQIKSATGNNGNFDPANSDIRFSRSAKPRKRSGITPEQYDSNLNNWASGAPRVMSDKADDYAFKTGSAVLLEAFHGTARADRVGTKFLKKRATSGPMSFFTSDPALASGYAQGKADTSLSEEDNNYTNWFKYQPKGQRSPSPIDRAWYALDSETKRTIAERMPDIRQDDDGNIIYEEGGGDIGSYQWNLKQTQRGYDRQGNPLAAAVETWLMSGSLFGEEQGFMQVLKLAGFPVSDITYDNPGESFPSVYKTWVKMSKPLVTSDMPASVEAALKAAAASDRSRAKYQVGADSWDKNTKTLKEWVAAYFDPPGGDNKFAWTSIPDKVSDVFRSMGYDGIIDWSGKGGGATHPVYIPFEQGQVKSATGNSGKFDPSKDDILASRPLTADLFRQMNNRQQAGMAVADVQKAIATVTGKWNNGPKITVVATTKDLPMAAPADVHGVYMSGNVYLVAANITDAKAAKMVLAHEAIAHHGLRELLGKDAWTSLMNNITLAVKTGNKPLNAIKAEVRKAYVDESGRFNLTPGQEADEIAAKVVEQAIDADGQFKPGFGFIKSVYAKIAEFLRSIGIDVKFTHAELQGLLVNAQRNLEVGSRTEGARGLTGPVFSVTGDQQSARALEALSKMDDLFVLPKSNKTDLQGIADDNIKGIGIRETKFPGNEVMYTLTMADGTTARMTVRKSTATSVYGANEIGDGNGYEWINGRPGENPEDVSEDAEDVWIDVSALKTRQFGAAVYNIAATYAHNTGRIFIGDPSGLSDTALRRRTEQMLSSALKFGTTDHLAPHPRQTEGDSKLGVPAIKWVYGDSVGNIERMIDVSLKSLESALPNIGNIRYDLATGNFVGKTTGRPIPLRVLAERAATDRRREGGRLEEGEAGWRTVARAALFGELRAASKVRPEGADGGSVLALLGLHAPGLRDSEAGGRTRPQDERILYSRSATLKAPAPIAAPIAAAAQPQLPNVTQPQAAPVPLPEETKARAAQRKAQDQFNRFTVIRNWAQENGMNLSQLSNVWGFEERMHGRIATRLEDFRELRVKSLVEKIQKAGFTMADAAEFLHAQHAIERNKQILSIDPSNPSGSGMTNADARVILANADPKLKTLANEVRAITDDTKQILEDAGIISADMARAWDSTYQHYVPLKGGDEDTQPTGTGKGLSVKATNKRAMGHGERSEFIIENILRDHERAVMLAEKNLVGHSLLAMAIELGRDDIATVGRPERRKVLKNATNYEVVAKNGTVLGTFDTQQGANSFIVTQSRPGLTVRQVKGDPMVSYAASPMLAENEVQVYARGHTIRIQLNDPLIARAYKKMGVEQLTAMMRINQEVNTFLSKAYTGYNPEFFSKNVLRDFTAGLINITGQEGALFAAKAAARYPKAFAQMLRYSYTGTASPSIKLYREHGGSTGAAYLGDIERIGADIQGVYEEYQGSIQLAADGKPITAAKVAGKKLVKKLVAFMEHLNAAGENSMRLAVFDTMRAQPGRNIQEAASLAKNATVNFNRKGEIGAQANALYLFFNAGMQGSAATLDALFNSKHKHQAQAIAGSLGLLAYSLAAMQFGGDDDEDKSAWEKVPDYVKDRNLVIRTGKDTFITLSVPYGYGFFFTLGNAIFDLQRGGDKDKIALKLTSGLLEHFGPAINPLGGDELDSKGLVELVPGAFGGEMMRNTMRLAANRSGFGSQIVPDSTFDEGKPDSQRMFRTSKGTPYEKTALLLNQISGGTKSQAGALDVSPETVKFWVETVTGGTGKFVVDTATVGALMAARLGEDDPEIANALMPEIRELPIVRTMVRKKDIRDARQAYWETARKVLDAQADFKRAKSMEDVDGRESVVNQQDTLLRMADQVESANDAIKARRDFIDKVNATEEYSRGEKRMLTKQIEQQENAIYEDMIELFSGAKK